jgi:hypothetical protein
MRCSVANGLTTLDYFGRDTSTGTDVNAVGFRPLPVGFGINLAG